MIELRAEKKDKDKRRSERDADQPVAHLSRDTERDQGICAQHADQADEECQWSGEPGAEPVRAAGEQTIAERNGKTTQNDAQKFAYGTPKY